MTQGHGLGEVFIQPECPGNSPGDLRDLQGMGQSSSVMIPGGRQKYLGLVFQAAKGLGMNDPVPVPLKNGSNRAFFFGNLSSLAFGTESGPRGED